MSSFSEYGGFGAVEVEVVVVVVEVEEDDEEAASASCKLGSTAREMIKAKISKDRDFMKTLQAAKQRY